MAMAKFEVTLPGPEEAGRYTVTLKNREDGSEETVTANSPGQLKQLVLEKSEHKKRHSPAQKAAANDKLDEMVGDLKRAGSKQHTESEVPTEGWHCYCWWIFCACIWLPW
jgi:hypothetical protein